MPQKNIVSTKFLQHISYYPPHNVEEDITVDHNRPRSKTTDMLASRHKTQASPHCHKQIGKPDDEKRIKLPRAAQVAMQQRMQRTLCTTRRTVTSRKQLRRTPGHPPALRRIEIIVHRDHDQSRNHSQYCQYDITLRQGLS